MNKTSNVAQHAQARTKFQDLLRHWRGLRRKSQLALAGEAGISARHLCFLETGRSLPSREMVGLLANALDLPLVDHNILLVSAGFASVYGERQLEAPELAPARQALEFMLAQQEPFPALVLDDGWNVRMRNVAASRLFGSLSPYYELPAERSGNAMHVLCHPKGLRQFMRNWEEFVGAFMQMLHRDAMQGLNQSAARLRDELLGYPGIPGSWRMPDAGRADAPLATMRLQLGEAVLSFFVTLTTFAMPLDVTLQQIRIESFFPMDQATADMARRLAADPDLLVSSDMPLTRLPRT